MSLNYNLDEIMIHGAKRLVSDAGEVNPGVYLSTTFEQKSFYDLGNYGYARANNPTREALENQMAALEGGVKSFAFASGMAAISAAFSLFHQGDVILIIGSVYGGTYHLLKERFENFGIKVVNAPYVSEDLHELKESYTKDVKAIYFETPENPTLRVHDIRSIASFAKEQDVITIVDNTFQSPYLQRPLTLGIDIVVESATKFLGGHSDLIGGVLTVREEKLVPELSKIQSHMGAIMQPFDAYLLMRGIKTLGVRLDRCEDNALAVAKFLEDHEDVYKVNYPGLASNENYEIHKRQSKGGGAVVSFELNENIDIVKFFESLKLITMAGSLGGVETLISHSVSTSHSNIPQDLLEAQQITNRLCRISVGIEPKTHIIEDLRQALNLSKKQ